MQFEFNYENFSGEKLKSLGYAWVKVCLKDNVQKLKLHVVDVQAQPLLGRDWLNAFGKCEDLLSVFNVYTLYDESRSCH